MPQRQTMRAGELGGVLDVVGRAGGHLVEHQLLGDAAAHRMAMLVEQLLLGSS